VGKASALYVSGLVGFFSTQKELKKIGISYSILVLKISIS